MMLALSRLPPLRMSSGGVLRQSKAIIVSGRDTGRKHTRVLKPTQLWDLKTGRCLRKFSGHTDGITAVMPGPDGRIFTANEDRTIRAWDIETGECARVIRSHSGAVTSLCILGPDRVVTGSADKKLLVFDTGGNMCGEAEFEGEIMAVALTTAPTSRTLSSGVPPTSRRGDIVKELFLSPEAIQAGRGKSSSTPSRVQVLARGGMHILAPAQPMLHVVHVDAAATSNAIAAGENDMEQSDLFMALIENHEDTEVVSCVAISTAGAWGRGILLARSYDKGVRILRNVRSSDDDIESRTATAEGGRRYESDEIGKSDPRGRLRRRRHRGSWRCRDTTRMACVPWLSRRMAGGQHRIVSRVCSVGSTPTSAPASTANLKFVFKTSLIGGCEDHIKVWEVPQDLPRSRTLRSKGGETETVAGFEAHRSGVLPLCMSPDARVLLSAGSDNDIRARDLALAVYARRLVINRSRERWTTDRLHRGRAKRHSSSISPKWAEGGGGAASGDGISAIEALGRSKD